MGMPVIVNSGISRNCAINDIIQSIALEEAALAHILNASGEAMQWVVAHPCLTFEELEKFQISLRMTLEAAAKFETALQNKICCLFEKDPCC